MKSYWIYYYLVRMVTVVVWWRTWWGNGGGYGGGCEREVCETEGGIASWLYDDVKIYFCVTY